MKTVRTFGFVWLAVVALAIGAEVPGFFEPGKDYLINLAGMQGQRVTVIEVLPGGWLRVKEIGRASTPGFWVNSAQIQTAELITPRR